MPDSELDLSPEMFRSGTTPKQTTVLMQRRLQGRPIATCCTARSVATHSSRVTSSSPQSKEQYVI